MGRSIESSGAQKWAKVNTATYDVINTTFFFDQGENDGLLLSISDSETTVEEKRLDSNLSPYVEVSWYKLSVCQNKP